nr:hypothetical protein [Angustibacter aerolatus]
MVGAETAAEPARGDARRLRPRRAGGPRARHRARRHEDRGSAATRTAC